MKVTFQKASFISKCLDIYYKVLHILLCLDFGCINVTSKWSRLLKFTCFVVSTAYCIKAYSIISQTQNLILETYLVHISTYLVLVYNLLLRERGATFNALKNTLKQIDFKIGFDRIDSVERKELALHVFLYMHRLVWYFYYCSIEGRCFKPLWFSISFCVIATAIDIIISTYTFLFYAINCRLEKFASEMNHDFDIESNHKFYKEVADFTEYVVKTHDAAFSVNLLSNITGMLLGMYSLVFANFKNGQVEISVLVNFVATTIHKCMRLFLSLTPAIFASTLSSKVQDIRIMLYDRLLIETDEKKCSRLEALISYIERRPLKFTVYKVIPLDASLLGIVFNFCATYLIVIAQFTHII